MNAESSAFAALFFAIGIALQAVAMLRGSFQRGDSKRMWKVAGLSLLGMAGRGSRGQSYSVLGHIFLSLTLFAILFAYQFRERLLPAVGGRLLLAWNLVLIDVVVRAGWGSPVTYALLAVPTLLTVVNGFTDIDRAYGWKVFFHAWFATILVLIGVRGFEAGPLAFFLGDSTGWVEPSPLDMLVGGAAWLYIVTNAWFVLALLPIPLRRGQKWVDREREIRAHMNLLARGYAWESHDPLRSLAVLVILPLVLLGAARWGGGAERVVVALAIALMPWLAARPGAAAGDDRVARLV
jgi:hypothetical protein